MKEETIIIKNELGLHARPAAMLVKLSTSFDSEVELEVNEIKVNAKSIMGVLMLGANQGTEVIIRANGDDEEQALKEIKQLFEDGFGEK
ncbi:HPr family phosphocarrier protein [Candidatus Dependentiae bacterium]|nr:HPr family phosphocarrier protein [Candidatus Dependentiae bacterium]